MVMSGSFFSYLQILLVALVAKFFQKWEDRFRSDRRAFVTPVA